MRMNQMDKTVTDNTETLNNALARIKELESQLQLIEIAKKVRIVSLYHYWKDNENLKTEASTFTVLEAYMKEEK
jgi:hypothetical protein